MRLRTPIALLSCLALGVLASGCFESSSTGTTVTGDITVQSGTTGVVVSPGGSGAGTTATSGTTATTSTSGTTAGTATSTTGATTGSTTAAASGDVAHGKTLFEAKCAPCHTLADAGANGTVGPNLDQLKPDQARVEHQIANAAPPMPKNLYTGQDAIDVAAYVSSVAGKSS
jgi:sulfite dehydrogenase